MTKFAQVLKYNPNHDKMGRFASGMPAGTEGKNAQPPVQGPRSGESQGTSANRGGDPRTDPVKMAPAPSTSVSGQDAGGTRSDDNKAARSPAARSPARAAVRTRARPPWPNRTTP
jgi:hypothetical protein